MKLLLMLVGNFRKLVLQKSDFKENVFILIYLRNCYILTCDMLFCNICRHGGKIYNDAYLYLCLICCLNTQGL